MRKLLTGILIGLLMASPSVLAFRMEKPGTINEWNSNTFTQLNNILELIWHITNGRYEMDTVTVDPDADRRGNQGEAVLFDTGTDQLCVNVDGASSWKCVDIT